MAASLAQRQRLADRIALGVRTCGKCHEVLPLEAFGYGPPPHVKPGSRCHAVQPGAPRPAER